MGDNEKKKRNDNIVMHPETDRPTSHSTQSWQNQLEDALYKIGGENGYHFRTQEGANRVALLLSEEDVDETPGFANLMQRSRRRNAGCYEDIIIGLASKRLGAILKCMDQDRCPQSETDFETRTPEQVKHSEAIYTELKNAQKTLLQSLRYLAAPKEIRTIRDEAADRNSKAQEILRTNAKKTRTTLGPLRQKLAALVEPLVRRQCDSHENWMNYIVYNKIISNSVFLELFSPNSRTSHVPGEKCFKKMQGFLHTKCNATGEELSEVREAYCTLKAASEQLTCQQTATASNGRH